MLDDHLYDTEGLCRHGLHVHLVNKKQILFIPTLQGYMLSEATVMFDYPMDAEKIGIMVFQFFEQMKQRNLTLYSPYKKHWLMPKGVRSYKKYVEATFAISLQCDEDIFGVIRWFPACDRGFEKERSDMYDTTINTAVSAKELGEFILQQFQYIEMKRQSL